jgi:hypothetical protein
MKIRSNLLEFYLAKLIFHKTTKRWHHDLSAGSRDGFADRQNEPIRQGLPTRPASGDALLGATIGKSHVGLFKVKNH